MWLGGLSQRLRNAREMHSPSCAAVTGFPSPWLDLWALNQQTWELTVLFVTSFTMCHKIPPAFLEFCLAATSCPPLLLLLVSSYLHEGKHILQFPIPELSI